MFRRGLAGMTSNPRTIQLWRRCLRCCKVMEPSMGNYYYGFAREHILAHKAEDDSERLSHLLDKGEQNLRFVLRKYKLVEPRPPPKPSPATRTALAEARKKRRGRATSMPKASGTGEDSSSSSSVDTWTPGR